MAVRIVKSGARILVTWRRLLLALATIAVATTAMASPTAPEEGFDYELVDVAPGWPREAGKITVLETFWYQCPQCNALLPLIEYWAKRDKNRINFVRIPLSMRPGFEDQETLYHTLEEIGEAERLHIKVFEAIHVDHQPLKTLTEMADFLEWYGIPSQRFLEVARSPAVKARRAAAEAMLAHYKIKSVPVLVVDGRFITSATRIGGTHAESVIVTEWLLKRAEAEQRAATKTK
jgi:thiol:disulfide interchange protein DsbA